MMRVPVSFLIEEIVPHSGRMCWLSRPIEGDQDSFVASATIDAGHVLGGADLTTASLGAWVGIEYMAQTVAAWAGWRARLRGETPRIGFLLGTRRYHSTRSTFCEGEELRVTVIRQFQADNGLGQFECRIDIAGVEVASAALTVFEPDDAHEFLKGLNDE